MYKTPGSGRQLARTPFNKSFGETFERVAEGAPDELAEYIRKSRNEGGKGAHISGTGIRTQTKYNHFQALCCARAKTPVAFGPESAALN